MHIHLLPLLWRVLLHCFYTNNIVRLKYRFLVFKNTLSINPLKQLTQQNQLGLSTSQSLNPLTLSSSLSSISALDPLNPVPVRLGGNGGPESTTPFFGGIEGG